MFKKHKHLFVGCSTILIGIIILVWIIVDVFNAFAVETGRGTDYMPHACIGQICDNMWGNCINVSDGILTYDGDYIKLKRITVVPPASDCDEDTERGRAVYYDRDVGIDKFYICTDEGWKDTIFN